MIPRDTVSSGGSGKGSTDNSRWVWLIGTACLLIVVIAILLPRPMNPTMERSVSSETSAPGTYGGPQRAERTSARMRRTTPPPLDTPAPEQIVAAKMSQFARNRLELAQRMAAHSKVELTGEIARFFALAEAGNWPELTNSYHALWAEKQSGGSSESLRALWSPIMETFGVAEQVHDWPAQKLLDYGNAILGSLRPGMVYVGGTDSGRFIPTFLNETSDGERHVVLTQNAFADNTYREYARFQYGDGLQTLTEDDSQRAFQDYLSDAQKRLQHDQDFPNEPRQVKPGEDIRVTDGRVQVSGQIAVMAINEKLMQTLMAKNPDTSFAIEQSFPFTSTYAGATTLGPIMELRVSDPQSALTAERATSAVDYWRATTQELMSDAASADSRTARQAWSKMAGDQAALLQDQHFTAQAEETFRIANELCPWSPEAVFRYVNLLLTEGKTDEALRVANNGASADPSNQQMQQLAQQLKRMPATGEKN